MRRAHRVNPLAEKLNRLAEPPLPVPEPESAEPVSDFIAELTVPSPATPPPAEHAFLPHASYAYRLRLPGSVVSKYAQSAASARVDIEDVMEERLTRFADSPASDASPLQFSDAQRREIIELLGVFDPESVIASIRNLVTFHAADSAGQRVETLRFSKLQLQRVGSRCVAGETLRDKLQEYADYGINLNTGLA